MLGLTMEIHIKIYRLRQESCWANIVQRLCLHPAANSTFCSWLWARLAQFEINAGQKYKAPQLCQIFQNFEIPFRFCHQKRKKWKLNKLEKTCVYKYKV